MRSKRPLCWPCSCPEVSASSRAMVRFTPCNTLPPRAPQPLDSLIVKIAKNVEFYSALLGRTLRSARWEVSRPPAHRPIFVIGCSRAGTTVIYKTLSESREIGSLQRETHDFWVDLHPLAEKNWDTHGLGLNDASDSDRTFVSRYFYAWTGRHRWVDKNNQNGLGIRYLHALFPDAVFVYVKRSPGDNLHSLIEGWGKPEEFATWSSKLPAKVAVDGGRYRQWCFFLSPGWRNYVDAAIEEVAAFQYESINRDILDARDGVPPEQWVELFYEDLLRDSVGAFRQVFEGCGLAFDARLEEHCSKVLDTPFNAFSAIRLDKWRDGVNRERIERALPKVAGIAMRMGYELS